jgi:hypothetical protein
MMTISMIKQTKLAMAVVVNVMLNGWMTGSYTGGVLTGEQPADYDHIPQA